MTGVAAPEAVVFVGIQGSGKTTFYRERFLDTHVRISLDMLRSRRREAVLLDACLRARQPFVVDNTNPLAADRARYVEPARAAGFRVVGVLFRTTPREAIARNQLRAGRAVVPVPRILDTLRRLEGPRLEEGFDAVYAVTALDGSYVIEELGGAEPADADPQPRFL